MNTQNIATNTEHDYDEVDESDCQNCRQSFKEYVLQKASPKNSTFRQRQNIQSNIDNSQMFRQQETTISDAHLNKFKIKSSSKRNIFTSSYDKSAKLNDIITEQTMGSLSERSVQLPNKMITQQDANFTTKSQFFKFKDSLPKQDKLHPIRNFQQQGEQIRQLQLQRAHTRTSSQRSLQKSEPIENFIRNRYKDVKQDQVLSAEENHQIQLNVIQEKIQNDPLLKGKCTPKMLQQVKAIYNNLLMGGYSKENFQEPRLLRAIHAPLFIKEEQFLRFKYYLINSLMNQQVHVEQLFKGCTRIESTRPMILNEPTEFEIFGKDKGISLISALMYDQIFEDFTLSEYFKAIDLSVQSYKFAKLFQQLIDHTESPNYTMHDLRERHVKYKLTHVQFANFKFYMSRTLQKLQIPFKYIRNLLRKMDSYKYAILNKTSLQECIETNGGGFKAFIDSFVQNCQIEPIICTLIQKRGKLRFTQHCENMFYFFFQTNVKAITMSDIEAIHRNQINISNYLLEKFKERAITTVASITTDPLIISDFAEDWDEITPLILGRAQRNIVRSLGGQSFVTTLCKKMEVEIIQIQSLLKVFEDNECNVFNTMRCMLNLILYNKHFYKKTELQAIHKRLRIDEQTYYEFCQALKNILTPFPQLLYVNRVLEDYKEYIVSDF